MRNTFAALTSTVSLLEVPVAFVVDEYQVNRKTTVWLVAIIIFLVGISSLVANGYSGFFSQFITYVGSDVPVDFMTFISYVCPLVLGSIFLLTVLERFLGIASNSISKF